MTVKVGDRLIALRGYDGQEVYVPERRMPQGAPTSPRMFDLVCRPMDDTLRENYQALLGQVVALQEGGH